MKHMETMTEAVERLRSSGYEEDFMIANDGSVTTGNDAWSASAIVIDQIVRFEGMSDPGDESMLLALTAPNGIKGSLALPYGPEATGPQIDVIQSLLLAHNTHLAGDTLAD